MNVGILGLGLIGGSLARAYSLEGHCVYAAEKDESMLSFAVLAGAVHERLDETSIPQCDLILLAIYPEGSARWLNDHAHLISPSTLVIDCCGTKKEICSKCFPLAEQYGFTFVGGHPMAGSQFSGFKYSRATMYKDAAMIVVPRRQDDFELMQRVKELLTPCSFGRMTVTTAENHDRMIAFSSQMAHVVSNAFVKSPSAREHKGYSAGSYKDMTRVAWLNETMWAELFMENKDYLLQELDVLLDNLGKYRQALVDQNESEMKALLKEGRLIKEEVDKVDYRSR